MTAIVLILMINS